MTCCSTLTPSYFRCRRMILLFIHIMSSHPYCEPLIFYLHSIGITHFSFHLNVSKASLSCCCCMHAYCTLIHVASGWVFAAVSISVLFSVCWRQHCTPWPWCAVLLCAKAHNVLIRSEPARLSTPRIASWRMTFWVLLITHLWFMPKACAGYRGSVVHVLV